MVDRLLSRTSRLKSRKAGSNPTAPLPVDRRGVLRLFGALYSEAAEIRKLLDKEFVPRWGQAMRPNACLQLRNSLGNLGDSLEILQETLQQNRSSG